MRGARSSARRSGAASAETRARTVPGGRRTRTHRSAVELPSMETRTPRRPVFTDRYENPPDVHDLIGEAVFWMHVADTASVRALPMLAHACDMHTALVAAAVVYLAAELLSRALYLKAFNYIVFVLGNRVLQIVAYGVFAVLFWGERFPRDRASAGAVAWMLSAWDRSTRAGSVALAHSQVGVFLGAFGPSPPERRVALWSPIRARSHEVARVWTRREGWRLRIDGADRGVDHRPLDRTRRRSVISSSALNRTGGTWSRPRAVIDSTSTQRSPVKSPLRGTLGMISPRAR